jgi:adenylyl-sulfate kinase
MRRQGHSARLIWLTGLSGAGKSSIADQLERELFDRGWQVCVLDGDALRDGLCSDLSFTPEDRKENIRRAGEVARLLLEVGLTCIAAFISPYRSDREMVRNRMLDGRFIEVYVNAPLEICERRDPKGLYALARARRLPHFTGISAPYEAPVQPELELRTDELSLDESVDRILQYLGLRVENPSTVFSAPGNPLEL